ncbi:MAG: hypothetical protein WBH47_21340 [Streptosporangiaceae bacterium]
MTGSTTAVIVLPIVIALALITWLSLVFYANAHPSRGRFSTDLRTEVRGGSFQAVEGGRQLMPIPEHRPAVPGQRPAGASETYRVPAGGATATATATSADAELRSAEEDTRPMALRPPR